MPSLPPALRATSLAEGGKDGGYDNPSVALRATPQLRFAAQPSVRTGPPLHKGGLGRLPSGDIVREGVAKKPVVPHSVPVLIAAVDRHRRAVGHGGHNGAVQRRGGP